MKGTHKVIYENRKRRYELEIKHKFTMILGDSGSGKSYLCDKLRDGSHEESVKPKFRSDLVAISVRTIRELTNALRDGYNLILIDEDPLGQFAEGDAGASFIRLITGTEAYFIFMARCRRLAAVPLDVKACFRLNEQYRGGKSVYTLENLYAWSEEPPIEPDKIVIEDSKVGYLFYKESLDFPEQTFISAHGNSNIVSTVRAEVMKGNKFIFVIADGCGFGVFFEELRELQEDAIKNHGAVVRYFFQPSFEYLVIKSEIFKVNLDVVNNTQDYADIEVFLGWEKFYTEYLERVLNELGMKYSKGGKSLPDYLRNRRNQNKIYDVVKEIEPRWRYKTC